MLAYILKRRVKKIKNISKNPEANSFLNSYHEIIKIRLYYKKQIQKKY